MEFMDYLKAVQYPFTKWQEEKISKNHYVYRRGKSEVIKIKRLLKDEQKAKKEISFKEEEELINIHQVAHSGGSFQRYYVIAFKGNFIEYEWIFNDVDVKPYINVVEYSITDDEIADANEIYLEDEEDSSPYVNMANKILNFEKKHGKDRLQLIMTS